MDPSKLLGSRRTFKQYGGSGMWFSDLIPHMASVADRMDHPSRRGRRKLQSRPGEALCQHRVDAYGAAGDGLMDHLRNRQRVEGSAWICGAAVGSAGAARRCGAVVERLPADVLSGRALPHVGDPILNLSTPKRFNEGEQREALDAIRDLNQMELDETGDTEITTRIINTRWRTGCNRAGRN